MCSNVTKASLRLIFSTHNLISFYLADYFWCLFLLLQLFFSLIEYKNLTQNEMKMNFIYLFMISSPFFLF